MKKFNVLIIDENPSSLESIETIIKKEPEFELTIFIKSLDLITEILKTKFDVIYLDFYTTPIDGIDLCKMIRESSLNKDAYIVAFTDEQNKNKQLNIFKSAYFDDFMNKLEINPNMFLAKLKATVRREYRSYDTKNMLLVKKNYIFFLDNKEIRLTNTEFEILKILTSGTQVYYPSLDISKFLKTIIISEIKNLSSIRVHIKNIRNKANNLGCKDIIVNTPKKGYLIDNLLIKDYDHPNFKHNVIKIPYNESSGYIKVKI